MACVLPHNTLNGLRIRGPIH